MPIGSCVGESIAKIIYCKAFEYFEHAKWAHVNRVMSKMKLVDVSVRPGVSVATPFVSCHQACPQLQPSLIFFIYFHYRRATAVVFSLEHQGRVIGRQSLSCRICSCPKRDKKSQENAYMKKSIQQNPDVQSSNNLPYVPIKKKPKLMYHPQHNSILKQPSVIEQISGKGPS